MYRNATSTEALRQANVSLSCADSIGRREPTGLASRLLFTGQIDPRLLEREGEREMVAKKKATTGKGEVKKLKLKRTRSADLKETIYETLKALALSYDDAACLVLEADGRV